MSVSFEDQLIRLSPLTFHDCLEIEVPLGWQSSVLAVVRSCLELDPELNIQQMKTREGKLRVYSYSKVAEVREQMRRLETDLQEVCPFCGGEIKTFSCCPQKQGRRTLVLRG